MIHVTFSTYKVHKINLQLVALMILELEKKKIRNRFMYLLIKNKYRLGRKSSGIYAYFKILIDFLMTLGNILVEMILTSGNKFVVN